MLQGFQYPSLLNFNMHLGNCTCLGLMIANMCVYPVDRANSRLLYELACSPDLLDHLLYEALTMLILLMEVCLVVQV